MVTVILEGNRREVYTMGFDLQGAYNESGKPIFGDIRNVAETFLEEDPMDSVGKLVFTTTVYER